MIPRTPMTNAVRILALTTFSLVVGAQALDSYLKDAPPVIWVLRLLPLLIFVPGLAADRVRTYIWLCFVILMYFITLVLRLFADPLAPVAQCVLFLRFLAFRMRPTSSSCRT